MFDRFLKTAKAEGILFLPLGALLDDCPAMGSSRVVRGTISGRQGWDAWQAASKSCHAQAV